MYRPTPKNRSMFACFMLGWIFGLVVGMAPDVLIAIGQY